MSGYVIDIEKATLQIDNFRKVLNTAKKSKLVFMSLQPIEDIGMEAHNFDQFIHFDSGKEMVVSDGEEHAVEDEWAVVIPVGVEHNVINTSDIGILRGMA